MKNDERRNVQHDCTTVIKINGEKTVEEGWEKATIKVGEQLLTVAVDNRTPHVECDHSVTVNGGETITVAKDRIVTVDKNQIHEITEDNTVEVKANQRTTVKDNDTTTIKMGNSKLE